MISGSLDTFRSYRLGLQSLGNPDYSRKRPNNSFGKSPQATGFQDPVSDLTSRFKDKLDVQFTDVSTGRDIQFEASIVIDGISYKGIGGSKKEAKQRMAAVVLRDKFGVNYNNHLRDFKPQAATVVPKKSRILESLTEQNSSMFAQNRNVPSFDVDSTVYSEDFDPNYYNPAIDVLPIFESRVDGEDIERMDLADGLNLATNFVPERSLFHLSSTETGGNLRSQSRVPQTTFQRLPLQRSSNDFCSMEEVRLIMNENIRLRQENEMLRAKLASIPVHSRLGPMPAGEKEKETPVVNKYQQYLDAQPVLDIVPDAYNELVALKKARDEGEMSIVSKKCDTSFLADGSHYALIMLKTKEFPCAYRFYGKGSTKQEAHNAAATLALEFAKRSLAGEKLIPFHYEALAFLYMLMRQNGTDKPTDCLKFTQSFVGKVVQFTAHITVDDYEVMEEGKSKKEASSKAAYRCLSDVYGYYPYDTSKNDGETIPVECVGE